MEYKMEGNFRHSYPPTPLLLPFLKKKGGKVTKR
jgi:hypothetical protein